MMPHIGRHLRVSGLVQGVCLRAWACDEARTLGIGGWVRNCSDGTVEAQVEGEAGAVEEFIDLVREGPPGARVDKVEVETADLEGSGRFDVRY
jgi:acylphosphatase